jgi:4-diphosphocytidyl-2-C-methyl-D-erythritol kinase
LTGPAPAKINLALVVGPQRGDAKHELATVFQRVDLGDRITVEPARDTAVSGFPEDTIVRRALALLDAPHGWSVHIEKHVPVASGLGGGSSDAATALRLANEQLDEPLALQALSDVAAQVGADVPFFLRDGPQLGTADGTHLEPLDLPQDFAVLLLLPKSARKTSSAEVYADFDLRGGAEGFDERVAALRAGLAAVRRARDLAALPANDLAGSPLAAELRAHGAFRADVSGAGPTLYGLFNRVADAKRAARTLGHLGRLWITVPAWYG